MNLWLRLLLGLGLAILLSLDANASVTCSSGNVGNLNPGDQIYGEIALHLNSGKAFSFNVRENSTGQAVIWGNRIESCYLACDLGFQWSYTATGGGMSFTASQSPGTSDSCTLYVTAIIPAPQRLLTFSKSTKDRAAAWVPVLHQGSLTLSGIGAAVALWGVQNASPTAIEIGGVCILGGLTATVGEAAAKYIASSDPPCIEDYTQTIVPAYQDAQSLGGQDCTTFTDATLAWICNNLNADLVQLDWTSRGMSESSDCYIQSCADGNCQDMRKWESIWYLNRHGDALRDTAYFDYVTGWYCGQVGCDQTTIDYIDQQAATIDSIGGEMQGVTQ